MKKIYLIIAFIALLTNKYNTQTLNWNWGNLIGANTTGHKIKTDNVGNVYVAASLTSSLLVVGNNTIISYGGTDALLLKYDFNGNLIWINNYGGSNIDNIADFSIDSNNDIVVAINYNSSILNIGNTSIANTSTNYDAVIFKVNNSGNLIWHKPLTGNQAEYLFSVKTTSNNDIYFNGNFNSSAITLNSIAYAQTSNVNIVFNGKINSNGITYWLKILESNNTSGTFGAEPMCIDIQGNSYTDIYYSSNTPSVISIGSYTFNNIPSGSSEFIVKYNTNGNIQWIKNINSYGTITVKEIKIDNNNNIVFSGALLGGNVIIGTNTLICNGSYDAYIAKFDLNLNLMWSKTFGGSGPSDSFDSYTSFAFDLNNNIVVGGVLSAGTSTFNSLTATTTAIKTFFINNYSQNGVEIQSSSFGVNGFNSIESLEINNLGYYHIIGTINNSTLNIGSINFNSDNKNYSYIAKGAPNNIGFKNNTLNKNINVYPNPFNNQLTLKTTTNELKKLIITNLLGQPVFQTEFCQNNSTIDLLHLQSGAYIVQVYVNGNFGYMSKLIKE